MERTPVQNKEAWERTYIRQTSDESDKSVKRFRKVELLQKDTRKFSHEETEAGKLAQEAIRRFSKGGMSQKSGLVSKGAADITEQDFMGRGFFFCAVNGHALALSVRPGELKAAYKWFDPNYGQVIFDKVENLCGFLKDKFYIKACYASKLSWWKYV